MATDSDDSKTPIRRFIGVIATIAISIYAFEVAIQPALVSISPVFADSSGTVNRTPDSPAQVALFATGLLGLFTYYLLEILVYEGIDEFIETIEVIYILIVIFPIAIIKNDVLPIFGIDHWVHNPTENNHQKDDTKND